MKAFYSGLSELGGGYSNVLPQQFSAMLLFSLLIIDQLVIL